MHCSDIHRPQYLGRPPSRDRPSRAAGPVLPGAAGPPQPRPPQLRVNRAVPMPACLARVPLPSPKHARHRARIDLQSGSIPAMALSHKSVRFRDRRGRNARPGLWGRFVTFYNSARCAAEASCCCRAAMGPDGRLVIIISPWCLLFSRLAATVFWQSQRTSFRSK